MQTQLTSTVVGMSPNQNIKDVGWLWRITMKEIKICPYNRKWIMLVNIVMFSWCPQGLLLCWTLYSSAVASRKEKKNTSIILKDNTQLELELQIIY